MPHFISATAVIITFIHINQCYYTSLQLFNWSTGNVYCSTYCKSSLASIHSSKDQQDAYDSVYISISMILFPNNSIWIGLSTPSDIDSFSWSDGSSFDYGNDIDGAIPWIYTNPDTLSSCVTLDSAYNYLWNNINCSSTQHTICNDCNGILNKYFVLPYTNLDYNSSKIQCASYGTHMASFHSQRDYEELILLCSLDIFATNTGCWIGLNNNKGQWLFEDGTAFIYGNDINNSIYPWAESQPDYAYNYATIHNNYNYSLHTLTETQLQYGICNTPSELCTYVANWSIFNGNMNMDSENCTCCITADYNGMLNIALMNDKQFMNGKGAIYGKILIDYMYNMDMNVYEGASGIIISDYECHHYMIGIKKNINDYYIFLQYIANEMSYTLSEIQLMYPITQDTDYLLSIEIQSNGDDIVAFSISMNNIAYISYVDITVHALAFSEYSQYIGVFSNIPMHAKSLYVSGSPKQMPPLIPCTPLPTTMPTYKPTFNEAKVKDVSTSISSDDHHNGYVQSSDHLSSFIMFGVFPTTIVIMGCCVCAAIWYMHKEAQKRGDDAEQSLEMTQISDRDLVIINEDMQKNALFGLPGQKEDGNRLELISDVSDEKQVIDVNISGVISTLNDKVHMHLGVIESSKITPGFIPDDISECPSSHRNSKITPRPTRGLNVSMTKGEFVMDANTMGGEKDNDAIGLLDGER